MIEIIDDQDYRLHSWLNANIEDMNPQDAVKFGAWVVNTLTDGKVIKPDDRDREFIKALSDSVREGKMLTEQQLSFILGNNEFQSPKGFPTIFGRYREHLLKLDPGEYDPQLDEARKITEAEKIEAKLSEMFGTWKGSLSKFLDQPDVQKLRERYLSITAPSSSVDLVDDEVEVD
jgi:hypothetical protein